MKRRRFLISTLSEQPISLYLLMTWIFDACTDEYGSCIRQYVMLGISLIILILALYSWVSILRQENRLCFQLLPIAVNTATSLVVFIIYTQIQVFNIRIAMLIVEVYSYSILTYGFVRMVFKQSADLRSKIHIIKRVFLGFSIMIVGAIIMVGVLSVTDSIQCSDDQGTGSLALIILEIPLFSITYLFSHKLKKIIQSGSDSDTAGRTQYTNKTQQLLKEGDHYKRIKLIQLKMVIYAFLVSFVLHAVELFCYFYGNEEIICSIDTNRITVTSSLQLYILIVQNISQMFPHFIIPFIFWYLPKRLINLSDTVYMSSEQSQEDYQSRDNSHRKLKKLIADSGLVNDVRSEEEIRQRLKNSRIVQKERHTERLPTL